MDYSATTPVDPRVVAAMLPFLNESFGNPASRSHSYGWEADARRGNGAHTGCRASETPTRAKSSGPPARPKATISRSKARPISTRDRPPHRDGENRTQSGAGHVSRVGTTGFRSDLSGRPAGRIARRRARCEQAMRARHGSRLDHDGQQRNRRSAAHCRDRRACAAPKASCFIATRCRPRARSSIDVNALERRSAHRDGAQGLRSEGRRCPVCAPQAAHPDRSADARRRPRARNALGHAAHASDRRHG